MNLLMKITCINNFVYRICIIWIIEYDNNIHVKIIHVHKFNLKEIMGIIVNVDDEIEDDASIHLKAVIYKE